MKTTDNENLQINIIKEGFVIVISEEKNGALDESETPTGSNSMKGGTASTKIKKKINQKQYDDKAKLYCSRFDKKISTPVFFKGTGYYKCIE